MSVESNPTEVELDRENFVDTGVEDYDPAPRLSSLVQFSSGLFGIRIVISTGAVDVWLIPIPLVAAFLGFVAVRKIRAQPHEYTGMPLAIIGSVLAMLFAGVGLVRNYTAYANELPSPDFVRVSIVNYNRSRTIRQIRFHRRPLRLDGKKVLIKGYVYPGMQKNGIREFLLVRDQGTCCFGGDPKLTDRVQVSLSDVKGCDYAGGLFKVAGVFHITPPTQAVDAKGVVFYHLDEAMLR